MLTGELGYNFRKNPEDPVVVHVPNFLRWGAGVGITPNDHWLIHGEFLGRTWQRDNDVARSALIVAEDGTREPDRHRDQPDASFTTGVTWFADQRLLHRRRAALGHADAASASTPLRNPTATSSTITSASAGPAPLRAATAAGDPAAAGTAGAARARADGQGRMQPVHRRSRQGVDRERRSPTSSMSLRRDLRVDARRPARSATARHRSTPWTAPMQVGPVPVTVTVTCPTDSRHGHRHRDASRWFAAAAKVYTFEDVHFDFDRYTLRPEALRVLEQAVAAMKARRHAAPDRRRQHLQHRHGRIQPGARRAPRQRGARLPDAERRRRDPPADASATVRRSRSTTTRAKRRGG